MCEGSSFSTALPASSFVPLMLLLWLSLCELSPHSAVLSFVGTNEIKHLLTCSFMAYLYVFLGKSLLFFRCTLYIFAALRFLKVFCDEVEVKNIVFLILDKISPLFWLRPAFLMGRDSNHIHAWFFQSLELYSSYRIRACHQCADLTLGSAIYPGFQWLCFILRDIENISLVGRELVT